MLDKTKFENLHECITTIFCMADTLNDRKLEALAKAASADLDDIMRANNASTGLGEERCPRCEHVTQNGY